MAQLPTVPELSELMARANATLANANAFVERLRREDDAEAAEDERKIKAFSAKYFAKLEQDRKLAIAKAEADAKAKTQAQIDAEMEERKVAAGLDMAIYGAPALDDLEGTVRERKQLFVDYQEVHQDLWGDYVFQKNTVSLDLINS